jgi:hypothetical protein
MCTGRDFSWLPSLVSVRSVQVSSFSLPSLYILILQRFLSVPYHYAHFRDMNVSMTAVDVLSDFRSTVGLWTEELIKEAERY